MMPNWRGGIQLGFDYMMPSRVVLGVEADFTSGGTKTATTIDAFGTAANQTTVYDGSAPSKKPSVPGCRKANV